MPPTPNSLEDLVAKSGAPNSIVYVFCTPCDKITVNISLNHNDTNPVSIKFAAQRRKDVDKKKCKCKEEGWVQFVFEGGWKYDNSEKQPPISEKELPKKTPPSITYEPEVSGGKPQVVDLLIWYGEKPKKPQREIKDEPGTGNEVITSGPNKGATRKMFATRFVCRNKDKETKKWLPGTHVFQLRWTLYHHRKDGWTKLTLSGTRPARLSSPAANCPK